MIFVFAYRHIWWTTSFYSTSAPSCRWFVLALCVSTINVTLWFFSSKCSFNLLEHWCICYSPRGCEAGIASHVICRVNSLFCQFHTLPRIPLFSTHTVCPFIFMFTSPDMLLCVSVDVSVSVCLLTCFGLSRHVCYWRFLCKANWASYLVGTCTPKIPFIIMIIMEVPWHFYGNGTALVWKVSDGSK